jgi:predicted phage terminase large subunit-like protein
VSQSSASELDLISALDPELFESADREQLLSVLDSVERTRNDWIRRAVHAGRDDILAQEVLGYTVIPRLHGRILDHISQHKRTLTVAYPGSGKTTCATITKSIGSVIRNHDVRILIGSKSQENAVGMLQAVKGHLESNRRLIEIFGSLVGDRKWDATAIEVKGAHPARLEPTINTVGYKGSVSSKHYDIIFADDLVDEENSKTQQSRDRMEDWFWKVLDTRLLPPDDDYPDRGQLHVLNTIFHWDDLANRLMQKMPGTTLVIPVVDSKGVYAWPKVHTPAWVAEKLRFYGLLRFALQFKCTSELMKGTIFRYDDCQRISLNDYPKASEMRFYIGIDLAISQTKKADQFAIVCIGRPMRRPEQVYVWDAWEGHLPFTKQTEKIAQWCERYHPVRAIIETNQYQEAQYQVLREKHPEYNIQPHPTSKNKTLRAVRRTPMFEAGNVFFLQGVHQHLVDHLVLFKGDGTTPDDLFDAFDHAVLASEGSLRRKRREYEPELI